MNPIKRLQSLLVTQKSKQAKILSRKGNSLLIETQEGAQQIAVSNLPYALSIGDTIFYEGGQVIGIKKKIPRTRSFRL